MAAPDANFAAGLNSVALQVAVGRTSNAIERATLDVQHATGRLEVVHAVEGGLQAGVGSAVRGTNARAPGLEDQRAAGAPGTGRKVFQVKATKTALAGIMALWPAGVAPNVQRWLRENLRAAHAESLILSVSDRSQIVAGAQSAGQPASGAGRVGTAPVVASASAVGTNTMLSRSYGWLEDGDITVQATLSDARLRPTEGLADVFAPQVSVAFGAQGLAVQAPRVWFAEDPVTEAAVVSGALAVPGAVPVAQGQASRIVEDPIEALLRAEKRPASSAGGAPDRALPGVNPRRQDGRNRRDVSRLASIARNVPQPAAVNGQPTRRELVSAGPLVANGVSFLMDREGRFGRLQLTDVSGGVQRLFAQVKPSKLGLDEVPKAVRKRLAGRFTGSLELDIDLPGEAVLEPRATVDLYDIDVAGMVPGLKITGREAQIKLDAESVRAVSDLLVNGVPAKLSYLKLLRMSDQSRQPGLRVTALLDEADRRALGVADHPDVRGPIAVQLRQDQSDMGSSTWQLTADLTDTFLLFPPLDFIKPGGQKMRATGELVMDDGEQILVNSIRLSGANLGLEGGLIIDRESGVKRFDFPQLALNVVTQVSLTGEKSDDGVWQVDISGRSLDARGAIKRLFSQSGKSRSGSGRDGSAGGLDLNIAVDTVVGFADTSLKDLKVRAQHRRGTLTAMETFGAFTNKRRLGVRLVQASNGTREILGETDDAGRTFKFLGLYQNASGGRAG
ncbi:MAG: hypothetical protein AAGF32_02350 [Pseudomonadota bacterium]